MGTRLGHKERARSGGPSERWELRGGPENRASFQGKRPDPASWAGGGSAAARALRFEEGEGAAGSAREAGQGQLEREVGRALRRSQDWPGAASTPCARQIPVVSGRARETHPDLESFPSKESRQPPAFGSGATVRKSGARSDLGPTPREGPRGPRALRASPDGLWGLRARSGETGTVVPRAAGRPRATPLQRDEALRTGQRIKTPPFQLPPSPPLGSSLYLSSSTLAVLTGSDTPTPWVVPFCGGPS